MANRSLYVGKLKFRTNTWIDVFCSVGGKFPSSTFSNVTTHPSMCWYKISPLTYSFSLCFTRCENMYRPTCYAHHSSLHYFECFTHHDFMITALMFYAWRFGTGVMNNRPRLCTCTEHRCFSVCFYHVCLLCLPPDIGFINFHNSL